MQTKESIGLRVEGSVVWPWKRMHHFCSPPFTSVRWSSTSWPHLTTQGARTSRYPGGAADTEQLASHATASSDNASQIALKEMMVVPNENVTECC